MKRLILARVRWVGLVALVTACGLEDGGAVFDASPDAADAMADVATDAPVEAAPKDATGEGAALDSGVDSPGDTSADSGCMVCPCAQASDCRNATDVCLGSVCTPCGANGTDTLPCENGQTCHEANGMCK
jgi:hypothetical protein